MKVPPEYMEMDYADLRLQTPLQAPQSVTGLSAPRGRRG